MPVRKSSPACPAVLPARTARTTATYSSTICSGRNGAMPNLPFMTGLPTPMPRTNRPPAAWSSCAAVLAASTGGRSAAFATAVPTRTRRVAAVTGWHSASASPCPSATNTAPNPARSAAAASSPILAGASPLCDAIDSPIGPLSPAGAGSAVIDVPPGSFFATHRYIHTSPRGARRSARWSPRARGAVVLALRGGQLRAQFALEDFAGGRARQRAGELHGLGALEVGQPLPGPGNDLL